MNTTSTKNNTMELTNKVNNKVERARKYAIMAISGLIEEETSKEWKTNLIGFTLDYYETKIYKVYKKGRQVRVMYKSEEFNRELDIPINDLTSTSILLILEDFMR